MAPEELNPQDLVDALTDFAGRLDEIYGLYLDARQGFRANVESILRIQEKSRHLVSQPAQRDELPYLIGRGDPKDPKNVLLHQTTQGRFKTRNAEDGANDRLLSQYFVVLVFHLWENEYRTRVAGILNLTNPDNIEIDILGDLRLLRNEILKNRGRVSKDTGRRLRILRDFSEGQIISVSDTDVERFVQLIKASCDALAVKAVGIDPKLRTIWHVQ